MIVYWEFGLSCLLTRTNSPQQATKSSAAIFINHMVMRTVVAQHRLYMWRRKQDRRVKRRNWCHWMCFGSIFLKTLPITLKTEPFSQDMQLKIALLSRGWKLSNSTPGCTIKSQFFTSLWNRLHQWPSGIELIWISTFSASHSRIYPCQLLDSESGFESVTQLRKRPSLHQWSMLQRAYPEGSVFWKR